MDSMGVRRLVFSSSATVYGSPQYLPIDEAHPVGQNITNPYGQTKYMCEQIMSDLVNSNKVIWIFIYCAIHYFAWDISNTYV